ncbi:MAG: DinB family protein [Dehalococcoidia bacterium]|nr:DinB family protein [Dehalococcoidia bacterium]
MNAREIIIASLNQSQGYLDRSLEGLTQEDAAWRPSDECNSIAFILWHFAQIEDFFVNRVIRKKPRLYDEGWAGKLGTPADESGYGYTVEQLRAWPVPELEVLRAYAGAVRKNTLEFLEQLPVEKMLELARPDRPPDTIGGVMSRIATEIALHVGQIDYLRGQRCGFVDVPAH